MRFIGSATAVAALACTLVTAVAQEGPVYRYKSGGGSQIGNPGTPPEPTPVDPGENALEVVFAGGGTAVVEAGHETRITPQISGGVGPYRVEGVGTPDWVRTDGAAIRFIPVESHLGEHEFRFRVSDGSRSATFVAQVRVVEPVERFTVGNLSYWTDGDFPGYDHRGWPRFVFPTGTNRTVGINVNIGGYFTVTLPEWPSFARAGDYSVGFWGVSSDVGVHDVVVRVDREGESVHTGFVVEFTD